jgi:hypothetical protein
MDPSGGQIRRKPSERILPQERLSTTIRRNLPNTENVTLQPVGTAGVLITTLIPVRNHDVIGGNVRISVFQRVLPRIRLFSKHTNAP